MTRSRLDDPQERQRELPSISPGRPAEPWEIGRLASEDADYITGQSIIIDGGLEMNWGQGA